VSIVCVDPGIDPLWRRLAEERPTSAFSSPAWMRVLRDTYGLDLRAWVVLDDRGEPTAGIPFCRISDVMGDRPNDLLMWESIKYAKQKNAACLDLGLSDWDQEGLIRYKRRFATDEGVISFVQYSPDVEQLQRQNAARAVFGQLTGTFTNASVPDDVSRTAGELLYRFLA
jgi:CelD/BcsL family acetyltransferase involved in cellulose biosynthesis